LKILFIVFTLLCPTFFIISETIEFREGQELFYQLATTVLVIASLAFFEREPIRKNKVNIWIGIFGIYSILLFALSGFKLGLSIMFNIFLGILLYFATLALKKEDTKQIFNAMIWVCILNMLYIALQNIRLDFIFMIKGEHGVVEPINKDTMGFMGIKAALGIYMALGAIAIMFFHPWLALALLFPIYLSQSTGAVAGAFSGVLCYFWWMKRKVFKILLPILIVGGIAYVVFVDSPTGMLGTRSPMWKLAMKDAFYGFNLHAGQLQSPYLRNPFTGFGLGAFREGPILYFKEFDTNITLRAIKTPQGLVDVAGNRFKMKDGYLYTPYDKRVDWWDDPHNEFVHLFYDFGLFGVIIIGFILYYLTMRFRNSVKSKELIVITSMLVVIGVTSLTQFPMHLARLGYLMPILLGLFVIHTEDYGENKNKLRQSGQPDRRELHFA